jgi:cytochrome c-type biogenesis protein CcmF
MNNIEYIGERLWPGYIGQTGVTLTFVAALLAAIAYFFATQRREQADGAGWQKIARLAFFSHSIGVFVTIGTLIYVMVNQYYEYQYVQNHVSDELPMKYIFSALWEGQEGSFLLWMFWHAVLGLLLIRWAKQWESPVMSVMALLQTVIASMILGVYVGFGDDPTKLGSNPMLLLRQAIDAPIFAKADYVKLIQGNGLNEALQNYWMTIHPPTLFLGFASAAVPFAFAVAGLWTRRHQDWLKAALPWALFSGALLGTGILMGAAWAYEALNFGGYWAWDPVENTSLVPWLLVVAGIHTNLVARSTGHSVRSTYAFYLSGLVLVIYSTFLTRSGILGQTSVHSFTEMGLETQLMIFVSIFALLALVPLIWRWREIPGPKTEEPTSSREFWMFLGALVLLFASIIITGSTSLPVFNKIAKAFNPVFEERSILDPKAHFNRYMLWIGLFMGMFSGFAQYLRYQGLNWAAQKSKFWARFGVTLLIAGACTGLCALWLKLPAWQYWVLLFSGWYTIVANVDYLVFFLKNQLKLASSTLSHLGFGLMIVGIMASGVNKKIISESDPFLIEGLIQGGDEKLARENILLFRNIPQTMAGYDLTWTEDTLVHFTRTYTVNFKRRDAQGKVVEDFDLHPNILYDRSFEKIASSNPNTRHYLTKDIFTHISSLPVVEQNFKLKREQEEALKYKRGIVRQGQVTGLTDTLDVSNADSTFTRQFQFRLLSTERKVQHHDYKPEAGDLAFSAKIAVQRSDIDSTYVVNPGVVLRGQVIYFFPEQIDDLSTKVRLGQEALEKVFVFDNQLNYNDIEIAQNETKTFQGHQITFKSIQQNPQHPEYQALDKDVAVGANLEIKAPDGKIYQAQPVFLLRDQKPLTLKVEVPEIGLHVRFPIVNPEKKNILLQVAKAQPSGEDLPIELATRSIPSNYIVLQAIEFPGINIFWLGGFLMMFGLGFAIWYRMTTGRGGALKNA